MRQFRAFCDPVRCALSDSRDVRMWNQEIHNVSRAVKRCFPGIVTCDYWPTCAHWNALIVLYITHVTHPVKVIWHRAVSVCAISSIENTSSYMSLMFHNSYEIGHLNCCPYHWLLKIDSAILYTRFYEFVETFRNNITMWLFTLASIDEAKCLICRDILFSRTIFGMRTRDEFRLFLLFTGTPDWSVY